MSFYHEYILPHVIHCACGMKAIEKQRAKVVPNAKGEVLEIGMGSGLNLRYYDQAQVSRVIGLEPSIGMQRKAQTRIKDSAVEVDWLTAGAEAIPLEDQSIDTVMLTYALCTIPDFSGALKEMKRVLKPSGELVFCEHGEAPDANVQAWQRKVNPWWKKIAGGCNLNRPIPALIEEAGFTIVDLKEHYIPGPKIATYQYYGSARVAE